MTLLFLAHLSHLSCIVLSLSYQITVYLYSLKFTDLNFYISV